MDNPQQNPGSPSGPGQGPKPPSNLPTGSGNQSGGFNPAHPPKVDVRTMGSDTKSVQDSGGGAPKPYSPPPIPPKPSGGMEKPSFTPPKPPIPPKPPTPSSLPAQSGPPKPVGAPGGEPSFKPPSPPSGDKPKQVPELPKKPGSKKGLFTLILSIIIVVGAGVIGYFFVFPLFVGEDEAVNEPAPVFPPAPSVQDTAPPSDLFDVPPAGSLPPDPVPPPEPTIPAPDVPVPSGHSSLFVTPPDITSDVTLDEISTQGVRDAVEITTAQVASLKEVVFMDSEGLLVELSEFAPALIPDLFTEDIVDLFESDFTTAIYSDSKGSWPVYILQRLPTVGTDRAKEDLARIEEINVPSLSNFYLQSSGGAGEWKDGQVLGTSGRYRVFTESGASFNYLWVNDLLVLATNYSAAQEAVRRLQ